MARLARVVIPGVPHHVTQRGNRREKTFIEDGDYRLYLDLLAESSAKARTEVWAYCLNYGDSLQNPQTLAVPVYTIPNSR